MTATDTATLFAVGQIRLTQLSVFNWGSFDGLHTAAIDAQGTLITGDNGAGKTTLIDAFMTLLQPPGKASFNVAAAQGDRSDRNLLSYMRGSYGTEHDGTRTRILSKREGAVVTGISAVYRGDDGSRITLAALFWVTQANASLSDVQRLYIVARRALDLSELLQLYADGQVRTLKKALSSDSTIACCEGKFGPYQAVWQRLLHLENPNAPALLARALGLKKIDNLTHLIRTLVLEPSGIREDARKVVSEFTDLEAIHGRLVDTRQQRDYLRPLHDAHTQLLALRQRQQKVQHELAGLPTYLSEQGVTFWQARVNELLTHKDQLEKQLEQLARQIDDGEADIARTHAAYLQAGGNQLEVLRKELLAAQRQQEQVNRTANRYQMLCRSLGLTPELLSASLQDNLSKAQRVLASMGQQKETTQNLFAEQAARLSELQSQQMATRQEAAAIEARPDSNIRHEYQRLRDNLIASLDLQPEQCMFIGELVEVREAEHAWQGAIERALGGLRTTLLVPEACYRLVTTWLNRRHTGLHVRVQVVGEAERGIAAFKSDGYLAKLNWREHPFRDWLKQHLARFDLHCVDSVEALNATAHSTTCEGLVNLGRGRFEKKDRHSIDDREFWQLGFSNRQRLALLKNRLGQLNTELKQQNEYCQQARQEMDAISAQEQDWKQLQGFEWEQIDLPRWQARCRQLQDDVERMEQQGQTLAQAQQAWQDAKVHVQQLREQEKAAGMTLGGVQDRLQSSQDRLEALQKSASAWLDNAQRESLHKRIGQLSAAELESLAEAERNWKGRIDAEIQRIGQQINGFSSNCIRIISGFHERWETVATDWGSDLAAVDEYLQYLQQIEQEGLPELVEDFAARLNRHATQSLTRLRGRIETERDDIMERIETINLVLRKTEFKADSYLRLGTRLEEYSHVRAFNQELNRVLQQVTAGDEEDSYEQRYEQLKTVVQILDKASDPASAGTLESLRLLDPRYQVEFFAEERLADNDAIRDVMGSSSGKSGGEKESFAGIVVAASLAYVLTPDGHDRPVYCTVFLDEAFSNTAEAVSRRVLRVFRELQIHVNLITPYKNLNLARESARSLLIAERDPGRHESHLCEVTWEEIDQRMAIDYGLEVMTS